MFPLRDESSKESSKGDDQDENQASYKRTINKLQQEGGEDLVAVYKQVRNEKSNEIYEEGRRRLNELTKICVKRQRDNWKSSRSKRPEAAGRRSCKSRGKSGL